MVEVINCAPNPHIGESKTLSVLRQRLESGYHVILTNYYLRDQNSTLEIDLVVINRYGVWLLEVKDWYGHIRADHVFWQQEQRRPVSSPITSVDHKAKVMHGYLASQGKGLGRVSVVGFVILSRGTALLEISDSRRDRVFALDDALIDALTGDRFQYRAGPPLARRDIERLRDVIVSNHVNPDRQYIGTYEVLREIRRDRDLVEYEAQHTEIPGRKARIKVFQVAEIVSRKQLAEHVRRFKRDIAALSALGHHPNILVAYDFFKDEHSDEYYYLILEWIEGQTLADVLATGENVPLSVQAAWLQEIAAALGYCHKQGIIHRNLMPDNIYLTDSGQMRLGNFDFAKAPALGGTVSITGQPLVETRYTAPEQLAAPRDVDERADIYALGAVWYDLLQGKVDKEPIRLSDIEGSDMPTEVREVLIRMLAPRRADRYASCDELLTDLEVLDALL